MPGEENKVTIGLDIVGNTTQAQAEGKKMAQAAATGAASVTQQSVPNSLRALYAGMSPQAQQRFIQANPQYAAGLSGSSIRIMPDWFMRQGAQRLAQLGPLNQGIDWKRAMFGAATSPFSPWVAARELSGSGLFGGGGAGGKGGGIWGMGGFEGFMKAFLAIKVATFALKTAFEELTSAIKKGASLYTDAAKLGTTTGMVSRLQKTFTAIGLPEGAVAQLMASGQFSRGMKMSPKEFSGALLGTGRGVLGKEEYQAIYNLQKETAIEWVKVAAAARQSARAAYPLFQTHGLIEELKTEWSTFWQQLAEIASPYLDDLIDTTSNFLRILNLWLEVERELKFDAFIPKGRDKDFTKVGGAAMSRPEGGWERMGLVISGGIGGATDYARRTAKATEAIARAVTKTPSGPNLSKYANLGAIQFNTP